MKNLAELAALSKKLTAQETPNDTILVYAPPKLGKTRYVATVAKYPHYKRIYWFDGENGSETIIRMVQEGILTQEEAAKIILIKITDLPSAPYFQETISKVFMLNKDLKICEQHGRVSCPICINAKITEGWLEFNLYKLGKEDCVVVDSGSQYASSIMAWAMKGQGTDAKPGWDEYGMQTRTLTDVLSVVQAATTNHIWITHQLITEDAEDINKDEKQTKDKFYPLLGTKNFSSSVGKYFGTVIYLRKKMGKHAGGSSSTFMTEAVTGSRIGLKVEEDVGLADLSKLLLAAKSGNTGNGTPKP